MRLAQIELPLDLSLPPRLCLDSARGEARRLPGRAANQIRSRFQPDDGEGTWHHNPPDVARARRRGDRVSNCDLVAVRSLIDLVASKLALRAPALRAATALTRPNRSAQHLSCGLHAVAIDPIDVVNSAIREYLRNPSLLMRARAQATVRVWKKRPELQAPKRLRASGRDL